MTKPILRYLEPVIFPFGEIMAKLDTGADNSCIHFSLVAHVARNKRVARIRGRGHRETCTLQFTLAGALNAAEFNIIDRFEMKYQVLLGRSALQGYLIDPTPIPEPEPERVPVEWQYMSRKSGKWHLCRGDQMQMQSEGYRVRPLYL